MTTGLASAPLSAHLRASTATAHADAESSRFFAALMAGSADRAGVAGLLGRLAVVYGALEQAGERLAADPVVGPFLLPGLERSARLAADLRALGGRPLATPAAVGYAQRIAAAAPGQYVAHHYTRVLGDLSGGLQLGAAVGRVLGATPTFFVPDVVPGPTKKAYRALLDAVPLDDPGRDALVAEALVAYRLNGALVAELDTDLAGPR